MGSYIVIRFFALCLVVVQIHCNGKTKKTDTYYSWTPPTEPSDSAEDEEGMTKTSADVLCKYALTTTREVLDIQTKFMIGVIQQYEKIISKNNVTWEMEFENCLLNSQSVVDSDLEEIRERMACNLLGYNDPPDLSTNPLKPASISNLVHNYNHLIVILEDDKYLKDVDEEISTIRRLLDNAEAELHRFNFRLRKIMKRIEKRLASKAAISNCTQTTTPLTS